MKYIIMADGEGKRWNNYLGVPKHLIEIDGETILSRTVRLLKENNITDNDIIITASDERYNYAQRVQQSERDCEIDRFDMSITEEPICFLYGDVYYSEDVIKKIILEVSEDFIFFGSNIEIFAIKVFNREKFSNIKNIIKNKFLAGEIDRCIDWEIFRYYQNIDLYNFNVFFDYLQNNFPNFKNFISIMDETQDFDYPYIYDEFIEKRKNNERIES